MKISLWSVGKAHEAYVKEGIQEFTKRISKYFTVEWTVIPSPKNASLLPEPEMKKKEGLLILQYLKPDDYLIALDEGGTEFTSEALSGFLQQRAMDSTRNLVFLIGGAFGLDEPLLKKARLRWSLSQLTFPHQLVRLILAEQIYRACTILHHEKYHHR